MEISPTTLLLLALTLFAFGVVSGGVGLGIGIVAAPVLSVFLCAQFPNIAPLILVLNAMTCAAVAAVLAPRGGFTGIGPGFAFAPGLAVAGMNVRHFTLG